jgi:hypothetical protein
MDFNIYNEKIDMVFTYVNGNDPNHIKKKNKYFKNENLYFNPPIRYENLDEIIYSVNSVIKNLSWINKIYIVTDNQIPPINKLLLLTEKVIIIDHKQIIPKKYLPTFYSDVIESYLHNIPGLSEIFLYNNDDFFNLKKFNKQDLFKDNKLIQYIHILTNFEMFFFNILPGEYIERTNYTIKILKKKFNIKKYIYSHQTKILRKSTLKKAEYDFKNELKILRKNKFRNTTTINYIFLIINYENHINNNIIKKNIFNSLYIDNSIIFYFLFILIKYKLLNIDFVKKEFVCFNNISIKQKKRFVQLMKILNLV